MTTESHTKTTVCRCTLIYALMIGLTITTWAIGQLGLSGLWVSLTVLAFALFKGHLIGDWFMGLRSIRGVWRWVIVLWLVVPGLLITTAFVLASRGL